jgi:glycosyltransferase involved in cell wall biosynthesis
MSDPIVSVIVPCFNGGRFIDALLASLAAQTFRDFEIIIVDDGSTDGSTQQKLASLGPDVQVVHQENRGLPGARNTGFRAAKGHYVLPLDCDDTIEPSFLAETVAALDSARPGIGFVFTHMRLVGGMEGIMPRAFNRFDQLMLNHLPYCMLIRKSAWQTAGGYDETMGGGYEDWEFNIRLATAGFHGLELAKPLFVYRISSEGMLLSRSARMHGALWRRVRELHKELYNFQALRDIHYAWRVAPRRIGFFAAMMMLAGAHLLPDRIVGLFFYASLRSAHWYREWRGRYSEAKYLENAARVGDAPAADGTAPATSDERRTFGGAVTYIRTFVSVVLVGVALYLIGVNNFVDKLKQINFAMAVCALLLFLLQVVVVAWRFQAVLALGAVRIAFMRALEATSLSLIANFVLFTNLAGLIFRVVSLRNPAFSIRTLIIASLVERLIVFLVLVLMAIASVLWLHIKISWEPSLWVVAVCVAVGAILPGAGWLVLRASPSLLESVRIELAQIRADLRVYAKNPRGILALFVITLVSHLIFLAAALAVAVGTGIELTVYDLGAAVSATMLLASMPVTVSGWGVRELSLVWLLGYLGIPAPTALAFSVTIGVLSLLAAMLGGAVSTTIENLNPDNARRA